jgi:hypothetical protein
MQSVAHQSLHIQCVQLVQFQDIVARCIDLGNDSLLVDENARR